MDRRGEVGGGEDEVGSLSLMVRSARAASASRNMGGETRGATAAAVPNDERRRNDKPCAVSIRQAAKR